MGREPLTSPRLEARELWACAPGTEAPVVRGVSLVVSPGEWVAITGPNGSGKTTLAMALAGLTHPTDGRILVDGRPLDASSSGRAAAGVAVVLQEPSAQLFEPTVADEIAFAARNLGRDESEVATQVRVWAERLGLGADLSLDPHHLSAGRQQLVLLAAALALRPALLVADEPVAHLDPPSASRVLEEVRKEAEQGLGVVWITQSPLELAAADRVIALGGEPASSRVAVSNWDVAPIPGPMRYQAVESAPCHPVARLTLIPGVTHQGPMVRVTKLIEIHLCPGEITAFSGPNGSGKTVLLEMVAGLRDVPGVRMTWDAPAAHPPVLAAQYPELQIFAETVGEEIQFAARSRGLENGAARKEAGVLLAALGLGSEVMGRSPWALSAGERRLVQLVAVMIAPAPVVLLDEPTCGLDPDRRQALASLVVSRSADAAVVVASQDAAWVAEIGARVVWLGR